MVGVMSANIAIGAELTVLSLQAMKSALSDLIPQFEHSSGNQVRISYASTSLLVEEIQDGKVAELAILYPQQIERLQEEGKIVDGNICIDARHAKAGLQLQGVSKTDKKDA